MKEKSKKSVYKGLTFKGMMDFREKIYAIIDIYNLTSRKINVCIVEENEETAIEIILLGVGVTTFLQRRNIDTKDINIDMLKESLNVLVKDKELPSEISSFITNHNEDASNLYHLGIIILESFTLKDETEAGIPEKEKQEILKLIKETLDLKQTAMRNEEKVLDIFIEKYIIDRTILEYLTNHPEEKYLIMRKGEIWWRSTEHQPVKDPYIEDSEIRQEYSRQVNEDGLMQNNAIINENCEIGFILFKLGAKYQFFLNTIKSARGKKASKSSEQELAIASFY